MIGTKDCIKNIFNRNYKLSTKLIITYILIIAIPIIAFSIIMFRNFENSAKEDLVKKSVYELELEKTNIKRDSAMLEGTAQMVIRNDGFKDYISTPNEVTTQQLVDFKNETYKVIIQLQYSNAAISEISFFSNNPNVIEAWPFIFKDSRIKDKSWYNKTLALKGQELWEFNVLTREIYNKEIYAEDNNDRVVSLCEEVYDLHNSYCGVIRVSIPSKFFFSKMFSTAKDNDGQMFIIDKNNNIYTNEDSQFIKDNEIEKQNILKEFLKQKDHNKSLNLKFNDKNMVLVSAKIDSLDCYMINVASFDSVLKYTTYIKNFFIIGTIILIIILSIVTYFITSIILKRLYIIIQSMKKMQKGDFNVDIPVRSNDEIGELAHHFRKLLKKINELIEDAVGKRSATKEAELKALQTQIDSHFIYNVLENIKMMAEIEEQYSISDSLTSLGSMMRYNMRWRSEYSTLKEEIEHINNYVSLMNIRFDDKIKLDITVSENLLDYSVLKMSLQPLVENSLKHGIINILGQKDGCIHVKAELINKNLVIEVEDDGIGIAEELLNKLNKKISNFDKKEIEESYKKDGSGIALKNVNERIKLYFGEEYGIEIFSEVNKFTKVVMLLPY